MTRSYALIQSNDQAQLRRERLAALELDHYRNALVLEDAGSDEEARRAVQAMGDIERRMAVHRTALGLDQDAQDAEIVESPSEAEPYVDDALHAGVEDAALGAR